MCRPAWLSRFAACVFAGVTLSAPLAARTPQGSIDGSFENGGTGWTIASARIVNAGTGAFHGTSVVEIDPGTDPGLGFGSLSASYPTVPGQEYRVTFAYETGFATGSPQILLLVGGTGPQNVASTTYLFDPGVERAKPDRSAWLERSVAFFADASSTLIQIIPLSRWYNGVGWGRLWVDNVRVEALGRQMTLGRDVVVRATLPSAVTVGEQVELTVAVTGHLRARDSGGHSDTRPQRFTGSLALTSDDALSSHPQEIVFAGETFRVVPVQLGTPGIQRFKLRSGAFEVLSNPVFVSSAPLASKPYWGDIHIHTDLGHSGWQGGSGLQNYTAAREFADLDFAALTEHFGGSAATGWMDQLASATLASDVPGKFVALLAVETRSFSQGHFNYYLRGSDPFEMFDARNYIVYREAVLANLRGRGVRSLAIPHHFALLDPVDWRETDTRAVRVAEIYSTHGSSEEAGNWWRFPDHTANYYGDTRGTKGHDYRTGLARGQRLGAIASSDTHALQPGLSGLTCVLAPALTQAAIWDALYLRQCYATSGERILLDLRIGKAHMGETLFLPPGSPIAGRVEVHGTDSISAIELVRDGQIVWNSFPSTLDATVDFQLNGVQSRSVLYVRVRQRNEHRAWSSPIWIEPAGKPDLLLEPSSLRYDHASRSLNVMASNTGNRDASAVLRVYSSATEPTFGADESQSAFTQPALLVRVEPVNTHQVRLKAALFTPREFNRTFTFSGGVRLWNAAGYRIVADPRNMLLDDKAGTLSWSDLCGFNYRAYESKAGQITDFELLVDTQATTTVDIVPRIDGYPLSEVRVGGLAYLAPIAVSVPLGRIALTPPLFETSMSLAARKRGASVTLPGLPPGTTYLAVLDPEGVVAESNEDNNGTALVVPWFAPSYVHWAGYLAPLSASPGADGPGEVDPCYAPGPPESTAHLRDVREDE